MDPEITDDDTSSEVETSSEVDSSSEDDIIYKWGRVYRMVGIDNTYYIGSTSCTLQQRFDHHKSTTKAASCAQHFSEIGWLNVRIELISEHKDISKKELRRLEDAQLKEHIGKHGCLNKFRAVEDPEARRLKVNKLAKARRKKMTKLRAKGDENALAQAAKEQARKGAKITCTICNKPTTVGALEKHRATVSCVKKLLEKVQEVEKAATTDPSRGEELRKMKLELIRYEALRDRQKKRDATRESTCRICKEIFPHIQLKAHMAMHEREERQKAAQARITRMSS